MGVERNVERDAELIRVIIADDHQMFRQGVREMISTAQDIEVVGEAANGREAVDLARKVRPDVVLLDVEMPVMGAEEAMMRMLEISPMPRVIIVTMHEEPRLVRWFLGNGASAYLVKSASLDELVSAVRAAARSPRAKNTVMVVPRMVLDNLDDRDDGLSPRQMDILLLAARGLSNRQISFSLHIAEATVKRHLANIYNKIGSAPARRPRARPSPKVGSPPARSRRKSGRRGRRGRSRPPLYSGAHKG